MARHPSGAAEPADVIPAEQAGTLPGLVRSKFARSPDDVAYEQFDSGTGQWRPERWRDIQAMVARWRAGLEREGLAAGDRVAIPLRNGVEWVCLGQAALAAGLMVVPLYTTPSSSRSSAAARAMPHWNSARTTRWGLATLLSGSKR